MRFPAPSRTTIAAAASGLLLALSFPRPDLSMFAWFGLIPLLLCMRSRPFKSGFIAGVVFFAVVLYWLNIVMTTYGHLPLWLSVILYLLLVAYLALYWATATWGACRLQERCGYSVILTLPVFWVALEFVRAVALTGFPWATLGYSQQGWLPVIQSADLFGVYGVSYLLLLVNVVFAEGFLSLKQRRFRSFPMPALICISLLLMANLSYGFWRLAQEPDKRAETLGVGLIQGNIPQDQKWLPQQQSRTVEVYRELSRQAAGLGDNNLLIWPEAAMPFYFQDGGALSGAVRSVPAETGSALLFGSPAYRNDDGRIRYLNSAFLLSLDQSVVGRSDKIHLVPFGEYVPLGKLLPFVHKLVVGIGDFSPGEVNPLPLNGHSLGVLVCYEVIFPELARDYVRQGSGLLVNITNDAWFGESSAPWQHLAMARFRAIENRVWLARAANTGISAFITPSGAVKKETPLFESAVIAAEVGLGARPSFYAYTGDSVPMLFALVCIVWLWQTRRRLH